MNKNSFVSNNHTAAADKKQAGSVIKRRKTSEYLQLHNFPVQEDLGDLAAIGLLTYVMSLPEDWTIYKTQLQNTFSRRKVSAAWKVLVEKGYLIGFSCYIGKKKTYFYKVSDIAFTEEEYNCFVEEEIESMIEQDIKISSVEEIPDSQHVFTSVRFVMYKKDCTKRTDTKEIYTKETYTKETEILETSVNKEKDEVSNVSTPDNIYDDLQEGQKEVVNDLVKEYMKKGLSKQLALIVVNEAEKNSGSIKNFGGYLRRSLENTLNNSEVKRIHSELAAAEPPADHWLNG